MAVDFLETITPRENYKEIVNWITKAERNEIEFNSMSETKTKCNSWTVRKSSLVGILVILHVPWQCPQGSFLSRFPAVCHEFLDGMGRLDWNTVQEGETCVSGIEVYLGTELDFTSWEVKVIELRKCCESFTLFPLSFPLATNFTRKRREDGEVVPPGHNKYLHLCIEGWSAPLRGCTSY